jgi:hypothetical protein
LSSNICENITGDRLQEGMLCYIKYGYTKGAYTRQGDSYYKYSANGSLRDPNTGRYPNDGTHWTRVSIITIDPLKVSNLSVTTTANIATINVASISVEGSTPTSGYVLSTTGTGLAWVATGRGSQWTDTGVGSIYYAPYVGIGSSATPTAAMRSSNCSCPGFAAFSFSTCLAL